MITTLTFHRHHHCPVPSRPAPPQLAICGKQCRCTTTTNCDGYGHPSSLSLRQRITRKSHCNPEIVHSRRRISIFYDGDIQGQTLRGCRKAYRQVSGENDREILFIIQIYVRWNLISFLNPEAIWLSVLFTNYLCI